MIRMVLPQLESPAQPSPPLADRNRCAWPVLGSLLALAFAVGTLAAQAPAPAPVPADTTPQKTPHPHKRHTAQPADATPAPATPAPVTPPAPELPKWPVNEKPEDASVTWDSRGLSINASNSSLEQILNEVATETGAKVEGLDKDQRIFGAYGPGQPRDVLSQLLDGSGYNVLMIGDQGQGAPKQIVLTARHTGDAQPARPAPTPAAEEEVEADDTSQQQQQQPVTLPFRPVFNGQPRPNQRNPEQQPPGQPQPQQPATPPNQ